MIFAKFKPTTITIPSTASDTLEEHLKLLEIVAERLRNANLTISIEKSRFCQKSVRYLGFVLSENGISVDAAKIQPILDYPVQIFKSTNLENQTSVYAENLIDW